MPSRPRILIADDNEDAADTLAEILALGGYAPDVAYDGRQALELASKRRYSLLLLDLDMPHLNGYEVASEFRRLYQGPPPMIVAITGRSAGPARRAAAHAGFNAFLVKPISLSELEELLPELA